MDCILFIYSTTNAHLGYFYPFAIVNNTDINIVIQICFSPAFNFLGIQKEVEQLDNCMFNILRDCHTVSHSDYTILYFHQQCIRTPISLHTHQYSSFFFSSFFFLFIMQPILMGGKWHLIVELIYISSIFSIVGQLFLCSLIMNIYKPSLEKCLLKFFVHHD